MSYLSATYEGFKTIPLIKGVAQEITVPLTASVVRGFKMNPIKSKNKGLFNIEVLATLKMVDSNNQDISLAVEKNSTLIDSHLVDALSENYKTVRFKDFINLENKDTLKIMLLNKTSNANADVHSLKVLISEL